MKRRFLTFTAFVTAGLIASLLFSSGLYAGTRSLQPPKNVPKELSPCLPREVREPIVLGAAVDNGDTYYLVHTLFKLGSKSSWAFGQFLVSNDKKGCALLNSPETASTLFQKSLASYVKKPIARELALSRWRRELSLSPNRESFERSLREGLQEGPDRTFLFDEDIWALKRLGIDISDTQPSD